MTPIFGIGLPRTGTSSLRAAMHTLGFSVIKNPFEDAKIEMVLSKEPLDLSTWLRNCADNYFSEPLWSCIPRLFEAYPEAVFLNTVREPDDWVVSFTQRFGHRPDPMNRLASNVIGGHGSFGRLAIKHAWSLHQIRRLGANVVDLDLCGEGNANKWLELEKAIRIHRERIDWNWKGIAGREFPHDTAA